MGNNVVAMSGAGTEVREPSHLVRSPVLILLVGVPGSGKSTWGCRNAQSAIVVSQDDLIDAITPSGFDHSARPIYAAAEEAVARTALSFGRAVIVDRTSRTRCLRRRWLTIAREARCPVVAIVMSVDLETCRDRNNARSGPRRVSETRMERMITAFETPRPDEGFDAVLDDSACLTVQDVINALQRVRQA
jgi:predicted kinase